METTCGIFLFDESNKFLICRPTGIKTKSGWTIPKGKAEKDELCLDAAIRETFEETGLNLTKWKDCIIYLGKAKYKNRKKRLQGFYLKLNEKIPMSELQCQSKFLENGVIRVEIDAYEMVTVDEGMNRIHPTQAKLLKEHIDCEGC